MVFISRKVVEVSRLRSIFSNVLKRQSSTRPNIQKPREPHTERQKYLILTRAMLKPDPEESLPPSMKCRVKLENTKNIDKPVDNPYQRLMGEVIYKFWNDAKMVLVFHYNSIKGEDHFNYQVLFFRQQMQYKVQYPKSIVRAGLSNTKFENILKLFDQNNTGFVVCPEVKLAEALKLFKKMPNLILMAAIVDNRILSKAEIVKYSNVGDITNARAELVSTLNSAGQSLVSSSTCLQQNFVSLLDQHVSLLQNSSIGAEAISPAAVNASETEPELKTDGEPKSESSADDSSSSSSDSESDSDSDEKK